MNFLTCVKTFFKSKLNKFNTFYRIVFFYSLCLWGGMDIFCVCCVGMTLCICKFFSLNTIEQCIHGSDEFVVQTDETSPNPSDDME